MFITFDEEVNLIWVPLFKVQAPEPTIKLLSRDMHLISIEIIAILGYSLHCFQYQLGKTWGLVVFTILGEDLLIYFKAILQLRIYALYINHCEVPSTAALKNIATGSNTGLLTTVNQATE
ncbi:hypothetical protein D9613_009738 [Agrocybe pediades]|uniref:Uncharacterized protein n=1 Tax=Agrocybe pediades TaxID=84607 RepID=A0A8H4QY56_9AGAR|nr:hypothetical protein D9613_009738 [Agrocybe pediades]